MLFIFGMGLWLMALGALTVAAGILENSAGLPLVGGMIFGTGCIVTPLAAADMWR